MEHSLGVKIFFSSSLSSCKKLYFLNTLSPVLSTPLSYVCCVCMDRLMANFAGTCTSDNKGLLLLLLLLTESEFNSFESAVTSELRNASKGDLREGILKILKNILGPKIDWSRITTCVQRKEETVSEYTERFCQSAVIYSGIVDDPESVLDDKGPLVRIWSDGLVAEYRKALPFLDLTWSNRTLRSNLDRLTTWERDADVKAKVRVAAATFNTTKQDNRWSKRESKCKYCEKFGHWEKECRKKLQDSKRNAMHNSAPSQPAHNPEVVPPVTTETIGQLVQALLRAQQDQEKN